jgi:hypothetical protein
MVKTSNLAPALRTLLKQVDAMWPNRDTSTDGTEGDTAHKNRVSDHNENALGVVTALDITNDASGRPNARELAEALVASRDPRIEYIISNRQINNSRVSPWVWRVYDKENPHTAHMHISVHDEPALYNDTSPWRFSMEPPKPVGIYRFTRITATEFGGPSDSMSGQKTAYGTPGAWWDRPGVALPAAFPLNALPVVRVRNVANGLTVDCPVIDKGPHYDGTAARPADPYWQTGKRPRAETDPATNKAAIDLTPAAARAIGLSGKGLIDWDFLDVIDEPVPPIQPPPVEMPVPVTPFAGALDAIIQAVVQVLIDHIRDHPELVMEVLVVVLNSLLKAKGLPVPGNAPEPRKG